MIFNGIARLPLVLALLYALGVLASDALLTVTRVNAGRIRVRAAKNAKTAVGVAAFSRSPETSGLVIESDSVDYTSLKDAMVANVPTTAPTLLPPSGLTATTPAPAPLEGLYCRGASCQYRIPPPPPLLPTIPPIPDYYNLLRNREFCRGKTCIG